MQLHMYIICHMINSMLADILTALLKFQACFLPERPWACPGTSLTSEEVRLVYAKGAEESWESDQLTSPVPSVWGCR